MYTDNKQVRNVAEAAYKIMMGEKLHPNQQQLDVVDDEKIDGKDFAKLRAKKEVKKEEVEELDELSKNTLGSYIKKANFAGGMADFKHGRIADRRGDSKEKTSLAATSHKRTKGISTAVYKISKEEVEGLDELSKDTLNSYVKKSFSDKEKDNLNTPERQKGLRKATSRLYKEEVEQMDEVKMADLPSTKVQGRSYGASKPEPHAVDTLRGPKEKELKDIDAEKKKKKFSEMVNLYQEKGLKSLSEMLAKEETEVVAYPLDVNDINGVQISMVQEEVEQIEERHMSDDEMNKREDIVKSMKKGMAGFKERYGKDAKSVMYATATKQSMKD